MIKTILILILVISIFSTTACVAQIEETSDTDLADGLQESIIEFRPDDLTPLEVLSFDEYSVIFLGEFHNVAAAQFDEFHYAFNNMLDILETEESVFSEYLGANFMPFYFGFRAIRQSAAIIDFNGATLSFNQNQRFRFMRQNFHEMYHELGIGRSLGLFGMSHIQLDSSIHENDGFYEMSLGEYLNTEFAHNKCCNNSAIIS